MNPTQSQIIIACIFAGVVLLAVVGPPIVMMLAKFAAFGWARGKQQAEDFNNHKRKEDSNGAKPRRE